MVLRNRPVLLIDPRCDDVPVTDRERIVDCLVPFLTQHRNRDVCRWRGQSIPLQLSANLLRIMAEIPGKFHFAKSNASDAAKRPGKILLHLIANRVELNANWPIPAHQRFSGQHRSGHGKSAQKFPTVYWCHNSSLFGFGARSENRVGRSALTSSDDATPSQIISERSCPRAGECITP